MAEVEFRDGRRNVPPHVAALMVGIETYRLTYDQAIQEMNARMMGNHISREHDKIVQRHFDPQKEHR